VADKKTPQDEVEAEYDFRAGQRGKYAERFAGGTNLVRLEDDVAAMFPDSESVNRALRKLVEIIREQAGKPPDGR
jgi:hypothetical protein